VQNPTIVGFTDFFYFAVLGGFADRYLLFSLFYLSALLYVDRSALLQLFGGMGVKWGRYMKKSHILVRRNQWTTKNPTIPHNTPPQDKPSLHHPTPSGFALTLHGII
jgi:hypothetical protein